MDVDCDNAARSADQARQIQCEEAHTRAGLEYSHAGADVRREDLGGILAQAPQRVEQEISEPPGTDAMGHVVIILDPLDW